MKVKNSVSEHDGRNQSHTFEIYYQKLLVSVKYVSYGNEMHHSDVCLACDSTEMPHGMNWQLM